MLRTIISTISLAVLTACGGGGSSTNEDATVSTPITSTARCIIELNGDSIISSNYIVSFADYIRTKRPNFDVIDNAVGGISLRQVVEGYTHDGVPRPPFANIKRTAHVVLIELGGNDARSSESEELFQQRFSSMVNLVVGEGRIPVVTGIVPLEYAPQYEISKLFTPEVLITAASLDAFIHSYAAVNGILDANWRNTVSYNGPADTVDGVHLNKQASERFADRTIEVLDVACSKVDLHI